MDEDNQSQNSSSIPADQSGFTIVTNQLAILIEELNKCIREDRTFSLDEMKRRLFRLSQIKKALDIEYARHRHLEEQLRQHSVALQTIDQEKDHFIAILAHELRNPLTPIIHEIEAAKLQGIEDPEFRRTLETIERQTNQISYLLKDLLDVSRATRGKIQLQLIETDLVTVIKNAIGTAMPLIQRGHHTLITDLPDSPFMMVIDPVRLEQVIINLLNNAAKYTEPHGRIYVSMLQDGSDAVISVRDTGIGIEPELLPRIFDLFLQADQSLARVKGGLGVGLSLSRMLVQLHNGSIAVSSEGPGKGTAFTVHVPIRRAKTQAEIATPTGIKPNNGLPARHKILIIEDNATLAEAFARLLRQMGQDVRTTYSGKEALSIAADYAPEVIFVDIAMPGMDGYQVAKALRAIQGFDHVRMIALTGFGEESFRQRSREAGFNFHLVKPVDMSELKNVLNTNTR